MMKEDTEATLPDDGAVEVIQPSEALRAKAALVVETDPDAIFRAADRALADKADSFLDHARAELSTLRDLFHGAAEAPEQSEGALRRAYVIAHDLKGQGTSYGFSLMTEVAGLLCAVLRARRAGDGEWRRVAEKHVEALELVIGHGILADGGTLGRRLVDRLKGLDGMNTI
jgi:hypothetical protein